MLGERCKCKPTKTKNCQEISDQERQRIFTYVRQLSWAERKAFVLSTIDKVVPLQKKSTSDKRQFTFVQHLMVNGKRTRVCKAFYLQTTGLKESWIRTVIINGEGSNAPFASNAFSLTKESDSSDPERTQQNVPDNRRQFLDEFLNQIPKLPSHYRRKEASKVYLEPTFRNFSEIYSEYTAFASRRAAKPLGKTVFNKELKIRNIAIFKPRNDRCDTCVSFENGIISAAQFQGHKNKELRARSETVKDTDKAKDHPESIVITSDLQAVLQCPKLNASALYYKTKLCVHNFTVYNNLTKSAMCYVWHEAEGGLRANEFASCLVDYLKTNTNSSVKCVTIFSDGCTYQNRNKVMAKALSYFSQKTGIRVVQKILEKGHTQMPVDSVHSVIERKLKNRSIFCPADYVRYFSEARINPEPYNTKYLEYTFFKDFDGVSTLQSVRPGVRAGDANVTDIRQLLYEPSGEIFYQLDFPDEALWIPLPMKRKESTTVINEPVALYSERLKIKPKKYKDLQSLKSVIPTDFHAFYDQLPQ